jgi:hypothetical protein
MVEVLSSVNTVFCHCNKPVDNHMEIGRCVGCVEPGETFSWIASTTDFLLASLSVQQQWLVLFLRLSSK